MRFIERFTHLAAFSHHPLLFIQRMHEKKGDYFQTHFLHKTFHFTCDPDHVAIILGSHAHHFQKATTIFSKIEPVTGPRGLVQLEGACWQKLRRETDTLFRHPAMQHYPAIIDRYLKKMCTKLATYADKNEPVDLFALMMEYTLMTAAHVIFSAPDPTLLKEILDAFITLNRLCGKRMRTAFALPLAIPIKSNRQIKKCQQIIRIAVTKLINHSRAERSVNNKNSLLAALLANYPEDQAFIHDQLLTFLFAGYETTATSLACCFYLLANHPEMQNKLAEIRFTETPPSLTETKKCVFANAVYREALRLYPPAWILAREATENVMIGHHHIQKGGNLIISLREMHRRSAIWEAPDTFQPERFLTASERHAFAFIPFGAGKRICSGNQFAMLEAITALIKICQQFTFFPVNRAPLQMKTMITFHPAGPVNLQFAQR